ncbi:VapE domain-containing protein [Roseospira visakhapatnamensis]|uniref:Putative P-loop ATPase n=1 Tax=Roseospira visakhapatnamensis TaxID=390880 RepID=A0A7W6RFP6_9PROT|nr:VapE domain-containing protein [Roseospira visakhapatnamensis]MBB4267714.1 putative P-loop ATPase [Roseospira visakhapatnamensis]
MTIDLNDTAPPPPARVNLREVKDRLQASAHDWVPMLFPAGRLTPDRRALRLANLGGDAPRGHGSAEIGLAGRWAGYGRDWATDDRADPIELIGWATGLCNGDLYTEAARVAGLTPDAPKPRKAAPPPPPARDKTADARRVVESCQPLGGTLAEAYLKARGLTDPGAPDLLFTPDMTDMASRTGWPGMVGVIRDGDGQPTGGIHRTFLRPDGAGKASPGKKMLGPAGGGHVRLFPVPEDGHLGIAEGIETALSAHRLFGLPTWAGLSAEGVRRFQWPGGVTRLTIFADAGEAGQKAAADLAARLNDAGIGHTIVSPLHGDDFNDDLRHGATADDYAPKTSDAAGPSVQVDDGTTLTAEAAALTKGDFPGAISIVDRMVRARLEGLEEEGILTALKGATGLSMGGLRRQVTTMRRRFNASAGETTARINSTWAHRLRVDATGLPERNEANVMVALEHDPAFGGALFFDAFAEKILVHRSLPWSGHDEEFPRQWADADDIHMAVWLQRRDINVTPIVTARAVNAYARGRAVHPVRDYLDSLAWDGTPRLDNWLSTYVGAQDTRLTRAFAARWMISAVARIRRPGCKADHMLVLEGPQGLKKSTAFKTLCGAAWFTDELAEVGSKDAAIQMQGAWVVEMAELDAMSKAETGRIKAFLTRTTDRYRPPYGRHTVEVPRQAVLCGTVNHETWLKDETGGRRFWPVKAGVTGPIDLDSLAQDRDQLWAEAAARFAAGEPWWLDEQDLVTDACAAQEAKRVTDAWEEKIDRWLTHKVERVQVAYEQWETQEVPRAQPLTDVSVGEILQGALGIEPGRWGKPEQMRVGSYFTARGWTRYQQRVLGGPREWRYRHPG